MSYSTLKIIVFSEYSKSTEFSETLVLLSMDTWISVDVGFIVVLRENELKLLFAY